MYRIDINIYKLQELNFNLFENVVRDMNIQTHTIIQHHHRRNIGRNSMETKHREERRQLIKRILCGK
jgi:hypothetical protein